MMKKQVDIETEKKAIQEPSLAQDIYFDTTQFKDGVDFPITVGEGQVFILGDNRPQASDSRTFGCIDLNDVKGKVIAVIRTRGI